jgi:hypothetical protein
MTDNRYPMNQFSETDIHSLSPALKVGLLATVNPQGQPHLTLISTLMASEAGKVVWGQFTEGMSKTHIHANPKTGFLIMTLDKVLWRGQAVYTVSAQAGKDYDFYNNVPMFRYNAYFGVHTVHYMDLIAHSGPQPLPMNQVIYAAMKTMLARSVGRVADPSNKVMNSWTRAFFNTLDNLKFISYINSDGFPVIIPLIQAQSLDGERLIYSTGVYHDELAEIPPGIPVAVFGMALSMEAVLVRGIYQGLQRIGGMRCGIIKLNWVYNNMPPAPMQIYPPLPLEAVQEF